MAQNKIPRQLAIGIAIGGLALIVAVAAFVILTKKPAPSPGDNRNGLGPDTVQTSPSPTQPPVQLASSASPVEPASATASPSAPAGDPVVQPQSMRAPSGPPAGLHFEDKALKFDASFPGPANDPVIADRLADAQRYLDAIKREAARAAAKSPRQDGYQWRFTVKWYETARAEGLVSLLGIASEDRGGAHPAPRFDTFIAHTLDAKTVKFDDLMTPDHSPSAALAIAICEGLKAEKKKRIGEATIFSAPIVCVGPDSNAKVDEVLKLLAASSTPGKFGGAYVYYPPYAVGPYAEGSYDFVVPQSVFAPDLRPEFKAMFAGDPKMPDLN